jgi:RNA polymerase subunit RPABC4/transcription elongation factor Spt4
MAKIIWSCHNCGTVLPLWKMKCPNCHKLALSWLHVVVVAAVALPALLFMLRLVL